MRLGLSWNIRKVKKLKEESGEWCKEMVFCACVCVTCQFIFPPPLCMYSHTMWCSGGIILPNTQRCDDVPPLPSPPTPCPSSVRPPFITVTAEAATADLWKVSQCHPEPCDLLPLPSDSSHQPHPQPPSPAGRPSPPSPVTLYSHSTWSTILLHMTYPFYPDMYSIWDHGRRGSKPPYPPTGTFKNITACTYEYNCHRGLHLRLKPVDRGHFWKTEDFFSSAFFDDLLGLCGSKWLQKRLF